MKKDSGSHPSVRGLYEALELVKTTEDRLDQMRKRAQQLLMAVLFDDDLGSDVIEPVKPKKVN